MRKDLGLFIDQHAKRNTITKWVEDATKLINDRFLSSHRTPSEIILKMQKSKLKNAVQFIDKLKCLRQKDERYDCYVNVDSSGYVDIEITFPVTREELVEYSRRYEDYCKDDDEPCHKSSGAFLYDVCHERIEREFSIDGFVCETFLPIDNPYKKKAFIFSL